MATITESAPTAWAAMSAPSSTRYGSRRRISRSLKQPGSPSAAFTTTVGRSTGDVFAMTVCHFRAAGKPAPPRPRSPAAPTRSTMVPPSTARASASPHRHRRPWRRRGRGRRSRGAHAADAACSIRAPAYPILVDPDVTRAPPDPSRSGAERPPGQELRDLTRARSGSDFSSGVVQARGLDVVRARAARRWRGARSRRRTATTTRRTGWWRWGVNESLRRCSIDDVGHHLPARREHVAAVGPDRALVHARRATPTRRRGRRRRSARGSTATRSHPSSG